VDVRTKLQKTAAAAIGIEALENPAFEPPKGKPEFLKLLAAKLMALLSDIFYVAQYLFYDTKTSGRQCRTLRAKF
jgi:hypothetical protein